MAPAYAIPRLLARNGLTLEAVDLWEIHEAFAAQVLCNVAALESGIIPARQGRRGRAARPLPLGALEPQRRQLAVGHPFGATGARILSHAVKELAAMGPSKRALVL